MEKYVKEYPRTCPRTLREATHKVEYAKATCSRVADTMLHFACNLEGNCKECQKDYED